MKVINKLSQVDRIASMFAQFEAEQDSGQNCREYKIDECGISEGDEETPSTRYKMKKHEDINYSTGNIINIL